MPAELVQSDLARGTLVKIVAADAPPQGFVLSMHAVYRTEAPPGIAARWFIDRLKPGAEAPAVGKNSPPKVWGQKACGTLYSTWEEDGLRVTCVHSPHVGKALHKAPSELASPLFSDPNATPREFAPVRRS
jgi:hypothetical protein